MSENNLSPEQEKMLEEFATKTASDPRRLFQVSATLGVLNEDPIQNDIMDLYVEGDHQENLSNVIALLEGSKQVYETYVDLITRWNVSDRWLETRRGADEFTRQVVLDMTAAARVLLDKVREDGFYVPDDLMGVFDQIADAVKSLGADLDG